MRMGRRTLVNSASRFDDPEKVWLLLNCEVTFAVFGPVTGASRVLTDLFVSKVSVTVSVTGTGAAVPVLTDLFVSAVSVVVAGMEAAVPILTDLYYYSDC